MGYTTKFDGTLAITPALTMDQYSKLCALAGGEAKEGPGGYCQWEPTKDGRGLEWDGGEKFYYYVPWLEHIAAKLSAWDRKLNGSITWQGEEREDRGTITVVDNAVSTEKEPKVRKGKTKIATATAALEKIAKLSEDERDENPDVSCEIAAEALKIMAQQ